MNRILHVPVAIGSCILAASCSALVDAGRVQCSTDADCRQRGEAFADTMCVESECREIDPWSCAEHTPLVAESNDTVGLGFEVQDAVSANTLEGVQAQLCSKLDIECESPLDALSTDDTGQVSFDFKPLFDGYILLKKEGYDSALVFIPPIVASTTLPMVPLATLEDAKRIALLGHEIKPGLGRVFTTIFGCDMQASEGVALVGENMGTEAVPFYSQNGLPSFSSSATDDTGAAGFLNVTPGSITLEATLEDQRRVARVALVVRPDFITIRHIWPWSD